MPHFIPAPAFSAAFFGIPERRRCFSPKFDIYETETAYVVEGDLPGLEKQNLDIEFTDHLTLLIKGHIEKSYTNTTASSESSTTIATPSESRSSSPTRSLKATVEDEDEDEDESSPKPVKTTKETPVAIETKNEPRPRQWVSERTVGEFQRTFRFPAGIDQDAVTAGLENGVLKIVVPKRAPVTRSIQIQ